MIVGVITEANFKVASFEKMKTWSESKLANFLIRKCLYLLNSNAYYKKYWQKVYTCEIKLLWNQTQYNLYLMDNAFAEFYFDTSRIYEKIKIRIT